MVKKRKTTHDRDNPDNVLVTQKLGPRQSLTPEGFLLCEEVPLARIGEMLYGPQETPVPPGRDGLSHVFRDAETLFSAECIASFNGKPVVDGHPSDDVTPSNWKKLTRGFAMNVRRGTGDNADVLLADLLITDADTILAVQAGKREVSCGYDADYIVRSEGVGEQRNIIGNHIALVDRGRCGPRCAIGDQDPFDTTKGNDDMKTRDSGTVATAREQQRARRRVALRQNIDKSLDSIIDAAVDEMEEGEGTSGGVQVHVHAATADGAATKTADQYEERFQAFDARFASLDQKLDTLLAAKTGDGASPKAKVEEEEDDEKKATADADKEGKEGKTMDSAALASGYQQVLADAEILVPGFRMPTFDAALPRAHTVDAMCNARRKALDICYATAEGKTLVDSVADGNGKDLDLISLDCAAVASIFKAASGAKKLLNQRAATGDASRIPGAPQDQGKRKGPATIADLNKTYAEYYKGK